MSVNIGFKNGLIVLDEPRAIYYSGQVVSGRVEFSLNEPLTFSVISVQFVGQASVLWTEFQSEEYHGVKRTVEVKYTGQEEYFNFVQCLCGGQGVSQLPAGTHNIPFKYQIPHMTPSSFSGEKGEVKYVITVYVEYPDPLVERDLLEKVFEVVAPFDLNKGSPDLRKPAEIDIEEVYSCCCSSGLMTTTVKLPVSGYCPGQNIPVTVNVENNSSFEIDKIYLQIISKEMYRSQHPPAEYILPEKEWISLKKGPFMRNTKRNYTFDITVPDMIAPNLENCSIINIAFFFRVVVVPSGCNNETTEEVEICIGLVPLDELAHGTYVHPMQSSLPNGRIPDPNGTYQAFEPKPNLAANLGVTKVPMSGYPHPNREQPMANVFQNQINAPYPGNVGMNPPYPGNVGTNAPYPGNVRMNAPYPGNAPPYPTGMNMSHQTNIGYGWVAKRQ